MNQKVIIAVVVVVLVAGGFFATKWLGQKGEKTVQPSTETGLATSPEGQGQAAKSPAQPAQGVAGPSMSFDLYSDKSFDDLQKDLRALCSELDQEEYIKKYQMQGSACDYFDDMIKRLAANPPVVTSEFRDFITISRNFSHIYRQIGRKNIALGKDILDHEKENIETMMALVNAYLDRGVETGKLGLKFDTLYEYAAYFINTVGGRSYLLRRDTKTRLLANYYAILILDEANQKKSNPHGVDILPPVETLIEDIQNYTDMKGKPEYLAKLTAIRDKVRKERGL